MKESEVEEFLVWTVTLMGGIAFKFASPSNRGVADRVVCLPDGSTWFIELKAPGGRLSELQKLFAEEMRRMGQNYATIWTKEQVTQWRNSVTRKN